jgi:hypothetical protein
MMLVLRKASLGTHFLFWYIKKPFLFKEHSDKETLIPVVRRAQLGKASCSTAFTIYTVPHSMINVH